MNKKIRTEIAIGIILIVAIIIGGLIYLGNKKVVDTGKSNISPKVETPIIISNNNNKSVACSEDAKLCPDGSYVSRIEPNCEFAKCPTGGEQEEIVMNQCKEKYSKMDYGKCKKSSGNNDFDKSIILNLNINNKGISLIEFSYVISSGPNYLPEKRDFMARVMSISGDTLGEYGFNDPRVVYAEEGYTGPAKREEADLTLVLPYYKNGGKVDLIESDNGQSLLTVDISRFVDCYALLCDSFLDDNK
jgi:hypothetical protein